MLRFADADILPFDFLGISHAISQYVGEIEALAATAVRKPPTPGLDLASLAGAIKLIESSALRFKAARRAYELSEITMEPGALAALNTGLAGAEQAFAPEHGLPNRPWYRHHAFWCTPTMTVAHLAFAIATSAYILNPEQTDTND